MALTKVTYAMIESAPYNVMDYGADSTGATDCTAAIQAAVDAAYNAGGGTVFIPAGTYLIVGKNTPINNNSRLVDGVTIKSNVSVVGEGNTSIIKVDTNCAYAFYDRLHTAVTNDAQNNQNIAFKNLKFTRGATTFYSEQIQVFISSCENVFFENCHFEGWSGDAICFGDVLASDTGSWLQSIIKNVTITNCYFDGVDKNTRQAISIINGQNIKISGCAFKNTTRSDMPGAIDIEPERNDDVVSDITIDNNTFDNIGGATGIVTCALGRNFTTTAKNIFITNNLMSNCNNVYVFGATGPTSSTNTFVNTDPQNITFQNNSVSKCSGRLFNVSSIAQAKILDNDFSGQVSTALLAYTGTAGQYAPLQNFEMNGNIFIDCHAISTDTYTPLIDVQGTIGGGSFVNNVFISSGRWSDVNTPASIEVLGFSTTAALESIYIVIANNTVSTNGLAYSTLIPPFFCASSFSTPASISVVNNKYFGYTETGNAYSLVTNVNSSVTNGSVSFTNLATAPSNPKEGDIYYDSVQHKPYCWNGSTWNAFF